MSPPFAGNDVLKPTKWCIAREQKGGFLFYNSRTDELHLVPPTGHYVYQLCDGLRTIGDIESILSQALQNPSHEVREALQAFLSCLVARGVLEIQHG